MSSVQVTNSGDTTARRRSQRVMLKVSVVVLTQGPDNKAISEETKTVTVNAHGAMILLTARVSVGQLLTLRNQRSEEEVQCRVVYVKPHLGEKKEVGVDFMNPCPSFGGSLFLHLIGQRKAPKQKAAQNRGNEIRFLI